MQHSGAILFALRLSPPFQGLAPLPAPWTVRLSNFQADNAFKNHFVSATSGDWVAPAMVVAGHIEVGSDGVVLWINKRRHSSTCSWAALVTAKVRHNNFLSFSLDWDFFLHFFTNTHTHTVYLVAFLFMIFLIDGSAHTLGWWLMTGCLALILSKFM